MRELSLHILDLVENSIRAGAGRIDVSVHAIPERDMLRIMVEDDGPGLKVSEEEAVDPFYTTKAGKRTGLGLSLKRGAAEQSGGRFEIGRSKSGGVAVTAEFGLNHVDRAPLGDLAGTLSSLVCTNPGIDFRYAVGMGDRQSSVVVSDIRGRFGESVNEFALVRRVLEELHAAMAAVGFPEEPAG